MKLKPCPFCDREPEVAFENFGFIAQCSFDECSIGPRGRMFTTAREAATQWNGWVTRYLCRPELVMEFSARVIAGLMQEEMCDWEDEARQEYCFQFLHKAMLHGLDAGCRSMTLRNRFMRWWTSNPSD